jgi:hypothetical protein
MKDVKNLIVHAAACDEQAEDRCLIERPRYFPRQLITPDDMTLEQDYFRRKSKRHNRMLHGWGVVCGAQVCPVLTSNGDTGTEPWRVSVSPGYILGPYGDEIVIGGTVCFDLRTRCVGAVEGDICGEPVDPWCSDMYTEPKGNGELFVAVKYKQYPARPVRVQAVACGCDDSACEYSRWRDGYEICVLDECPPYHKGDPPKPQSASEGPLTECPECSDEPWVVLARVVVDLEGDVKGAIKTIDNFFCRRQVVTFANHWWKCRSHELELSKVECEPEALTKGLEGVTVTINGSGFDDFEQITCGPGISIKEVDIVDDSQLTVTVNIDGDARLGTRTITVINSDCTTAIYKGALKIVSDKKKEEKPKPERFEKKGNRRKRAK